VNTLGETVIGTAEAKASFFEALYVAADGSLALTTRAATHKDFPRGQRRIAFLGR